jgi:hypothetical protein
MRRISGNMVSKGGTAVAVKASPARVGTSPLAQKATETEEDMGEGKALPYRGFTWLALGIAAMGTLVVGVVLPIWLPNIQQAATQMLLR